MSWGFLTSLARRFTHGVMVGFFPVMSVVLLVEDDRELREMMTLLLDSCGIPRPHGVDGLAALMQARQTFTPRVVLLDPDDAGHGRVGVPTSAARGRRRHHLQSSSFPRSRLSYLNLEPAAVIPKPCDWPAHRCGGISSSNAFCRHRRPQSMESDSHPHKLEGLEAGFEPADPDNCLSARPR